MAIKKATKTGTALKKATTIKPVKPLLRIG